MVVYVKKIFIFSINQCSDVIAIRENDTVNNTDGGRLQGNDISLTNFTVLNNNGAILYYTYPLIQMSTNNIHNTSGVSQSTAMIIIKECGIASECKNIYLQNDASITFYNNYFDGNSYESGLIDIYCTSINMDFNNITHNVGPIINSETSEIIINQLYVSENVYQKMRMNHLQGFEIYLKHDDEMIFTNCQYATFSIDFLTSTNAIESQTNRRRLSGESTTANPTLSPTLTPTLAPTFSPTSSATVAPVVDSSYSQVLFDNFEFNNYFDQYAIRFDTNNQNWSTNATFYNGKSYNNDNNYNNTDSALISMLNGYSNTEQKSIFKFDEVQFADSGDIFSIIENTENEVFQVVHH